MQYVFPIYKEWDAENVINNLEFLRSKIPLENFKLTYDALTFEKKGYFVINISHKDMKLKSAIHIWRDKVEITAKDWKNCWVAAAILTNLLKEEKSSFFLDSLYSEFKIKGDFNEQFQEFCLFFIFSQYLDLVNKKVPIEAVQQVKEVVRLNLKLMLQAIDEIE